MSDAKTAIERALSAARSTIDSIGEQAAIIERMADRIVRAFSDGKKVMFIGNGGSAADAQHAAAELVGRLGLGVERKPLPALALTTDTSAITAIANDFGFENIFARQIEAIAQPGDVLVCISTSGTSHNILSAARSAIDIGCTVLSLTGGDESPLSEKSDICLRIEGDNTPRIQEGHEIALHILCELVESKFAG